MRITWRWPSITVLRRCYWISRIMPKSRYFLQPGSMTGTRIPILTQKDIDREPTADANPRFGMTFHSPDWVTDYLAPMGSIGFGVRNLDVLPMSISERYIYPLRENQPMKQNNHFEKLRFRQSVTLSKRIYDMMDGGKKIFSQEGIAEALPILQRIQSTVVFSHDDVQSVI